MVATLANAFLLPMLPEGFEMRCCECDLWWFVPGGGVLEAEGALDDETEMAGFGPASEGAVLADTILTAAVSFFVLKTVVVFPLFRLLLLRMGTLGPDILTVVVMRVVRPAGAGDDDDDDGEVEFDDPRPACAPIAASAGCTAPEIVAAAAAVVLGTTGTEQALPAVSAACAAK
jgi:hypothetical protein